MGKTFRSAGKVKFALDCNDKIFQWTFVWLILDEYVTNLLNNGSKVPVDIDGSNEMQLPDWADESKIKKLVHNKLSRY